MAIEIPRGRLQDQKFFGALESLRGVASLFVVLYHIPRWYEPFYELGLVRSGHLAVEFFFVLSGFVLYHSYGNRISDRASFSRFVLLRICRLYPVHFAFMVIFFLTELAKYVSATRHGLVPPASRTELATALVENTFLVQGLGLRARQVYLNFPSWSISTEFYTYLIFGCAALALSRKRFVGFAAGISFISLGALTLFFDGTGEFQQMLRCVGGFFLGCLVRVLFSRMSGDESKYDWAALLLAAIAVGVSINWSGPSKLWELGFPLSALLILALVTKPSGATSRALGWPPLRWLGEISYSLYMSHAFALRIAARLLQFVLRRPMDAATLPDPPLKLPLALFSYGTALATAIAIGWVTYILIERPAKAAMKSFAQQPARVQSP